MKMRLRQHGRLFPGFLSAFFCNRKKQAAVWCHSPKMGSRCGSKCLSRLENDFALARTADEFAGGQPEIVLAKGVKLGGRFEAAVGHEFSGGHAGEGGLEGNAFKLLLLEPLLGRHAELFEKATVEHGFAHLRQFDEFFHRAHLGLVAGNDVAEVGAVIFGHDGAEQACQFILAIRGKEQEEEFFAFQVSKVAVQQTFRFVLLHLLTQHIDRRVYLQSVKWILVRVEKKVGPLNEQTVIGFRQGLGIQHHIMRGAQKIGLDFGVFLQRKAIGGFNQCTLHRSFNLEQKIAFEHHNHAVFVYLKLYRIAFLPLVKGKTGAFGILRVMLLLMLLL